MSYHKAPFRARGPSWLVSHGKKVDELSIASITDRYFPQRAYKLDSSKNKLLYLDIHKLQWLTCNTRSPPDALSEPAPCFEFYPWRLSNSSMGYTALLSYFDSLNSASTILVDVSAGFRNPRVVESTSNF